MNSAPHRRGMPIQLPPGVDPAIAAMASQPAMPQQAGIAIAQPLNDMQLVSQMAATLYMHDQCPSVEAAVKTAIDILMTTIEQMTPEKMHARFLARSAEAQAAHSID